MSRKPVVTPDPVRYLSTNLDPNDGGRLWRVIGFGALPECRDSAELGDALTSWERHDRPATRHVDIPVWDGNVGAFTTLGAFGWVTVPAAELPTWRATDSAFRLVEWTPGHFRLFATSGLKFEVDRTECPSAPHAFVWASLARSRA